MTRDPQRVPDYLGHILEAIQRIERYAGGIDEAAFLASDMRNALSHGYFKIDLQIDWKTTQNDRPRVRGEMP